MVVEAGGDGDGRRGNEIGGLSPWGVGAGRVVGMLDGGGAGIRGGWSK